MAENDYTKPPKKRTGPNKKALELVKYFDDEHPDYNYLRAVFSELRKALGVKVGHQIKKLPHVPTEDEIKRYYEFVWKDKNLRDVIIIKTLLYTGIRVSELIRLELKDVDLDKCQIQVRVPRGQKDRIVPFPKSFRETLALHIANSQGKGSCSLFESSRGTAYSDSGIRRILEKYSQIAGMENNISPQKLRHFLFTWLKKQGVDDALIQQYSGHEKLESLGVYTELSLIQARNSYDANIRDFPI